MPSFTTCRRIEFADTDMAGIAHFTALFRYMESAEHEFLRHVGMSVVGKDENAVTLSWPRVAAQCDFQSAARFEDEVEIEMGIERIGEKSVTYRFQFRLDGRPLAEGRMTSVCCRITPGRPPVPIPIPPDVRRRLQQAGSPQ